MAPKKELTVNKGISPYARNLIVVRIFHFDANFVVAFLGISGQNLGAWGVYTGPGGLWDQFPPSSTANGGRGNELSPPKLIIHRIWIGTAATESRATYAENGPRVEKKDRRY